jgi:hypothetical protein
MRTHVYLVGAVACPLLPILPFLRVQDVVADDSGGAVACSVLLGSGSHYHSCVIYVVAGVGRGAVACRSPWFPPLTTIPACSMLLLVVAAVLLPAAYCLVPLTHYHPARSMLLLVPLYSAWSLL